MNCYRETIKIKRAFKYSVPALLVFLAVASFVCNKSYAEVADQVPPKVAEADIAVGQAFNAVLHAEQAGANVTSLLAQLNDAAALLAQAEMASRNGDANAAADNATGALSIASEVKAEAVDAKASALVAGTNALWFTTVFSVVGATALVLALFLVWRRLKHGYFKNSLESKPEATS
jgi:hypothetical protein